MAKPLFRFGQAQGSFKGIAWDDGGHGVERRAEWARRAERSQERRASGEPAERNVVRPAFIIYTVYILYCNVLDMQCVLINLCHMYVVVSIVTESDYFNV